MRKNLLTLAIFVIFSICITNLYLSGHKVYAQESTNIDTKVSEKTFLGLNLAAIDLSKEQTEKIEALKSTLKVEVQDISEKLEEKNLEMRTLWESYPPDVGKIVAKQKEIGSLRAELQEKTIIYRVKAIEILTEEQFRKVSLPKKRQPRPKL